MQLSIVAILILAFVVVDAVGDVGGLLDFSQIATGSDGMDASGRDEETVALLDLILCQGIADGVVGYHLLILLRGELHLQTVIELGIGSRLHDIPHLRLTTRLALTVGYLVGRVYLDGQVLMGVDKLDQQGELIAKALVVGFAYEGCLLFGNQGVEGLGGGTTQYWGFIVFDTRNLPALCTPDERFQQRLEFVIVCHIICFNYLSRRHG